MRGELCDEPYGGFRIAEADIDVAPLTMLFIKSSIRERHIANTECQNAEG
jgi:hypothetical protein